MTVIIKANPIQIGHFQNSQKAQERRCMLMLEK